MSEDFEFKPLTEGLGFHKKALELKDDGAQKLATETGILPKSKTNSVVSQMMPAQTIAASSVNKAVAWNAEAQKKQFTQSMAQALNKKSLNAPIQNMQAVKYEAISFSWAAAAFDAAMILGMTLLFSAVVFALTLIDVTTIYDALLTDIGVQVASLLIVFAVFEIYTVSCRTFFGKTLGEWVFDVRLGMPQEQLSFSYPFRVALRSFLVTVTGFILLPVMSSLFGKDIAGSLTGARLLCERR